VKSGARARPEQVGTPQVSQITRQNIKGCLARRKGKENTHCLTYFEPARADATWLNGKRRQFPHSTAPGGYGDLASSAQVALKELTHLATSGMELSQWYFILDAEIAVEMLALELGHLSFDICPRRCPRARRASPWIHSSSSRSPRRVSCALESSATRSLKCSVITRPSSFLRHSTGSSPERSQWPVSAQAPISGVRPLTAAKTVFRLQ